MFKRVAGNSDYKGKLLVEKFKQEMDRRIRKQLMEAECPLKSIKQQYERSTRLDRNCRESRREEERMRSKMKDKERKKKKIKGEQRRIEEIRTKEKIQAEKKQRQQEEWKRQRQMNRKREIQKRNCFGCREFGHIIRNCRIKEVKKVIIL